ncbi:hypothetical protein N9D34_01170 [Salibacteraceae bacterium]|nr:hypothetical protein [Salibacteraceae bacterium]|tara:strand:- start:102 stop:959 length:858 start_codon:yes stop_codon:yes gene_type:complete
MLKNYLNSCVLIAFVSAISWSCSDNSKLEKAQNNSLNETLEETERQDNSKSMTHELGSVRKNIEQAANLYQRLYNAECPFNSDVVSEDFPQFNTTREKALAMGRYAALFVYTAAYEQTKYATAYLNEVLILSEDIGIRDAFNEDQLKLLYDPNSAIDKSAVLTKAYLKATEQMYSEEKALLVSYMVLGGWIQGMKLSYAICGNYLKDQNVSLSLYDQSYSFYNCVRLLEETKDQVDSPNLVLLKLDTIRPDIESLVKSRGNIDAELFEALKEKISILEKEINSLD